MPAVRESDGTAPGALEIVEVRPGVRLKLNAADKAAIQKAEADAAERQRAWNLVNAGVEDKPAKAKAEADDDAPSKAKKK